MATTTPKETKEVKAVKKPAKKVEKKEEAVSSGFSVIKTGGKQYLVKVGDVVTIEKMIGDYKVGDKIVFNEVLLNQDGETVTLGAPFIAKGTVEGELVVIGRNQKVTVIKYKQKSRYFKKNGHRQPHFKVRITKI